MSRRNLIGNLIQEQLAAANSQRPSADKGEPAPRVTAGPVRTMGLTLDKLELERKSLEEALAAGGAIVEIATDLVEGSFAADRFAESADAAFETLKQSIAAQRPGGADPRPADAGKPGRYQVAYGHRRLRACRQLGRPVRALVKPLGDAELVVAQGLENAARVDLSFIEKAVFAHGLERRGFDRTTIMAALARREDRALHDDLGRREPARTAGARHRSCAEGGPAPLAAAGGAAKDDGAGEGRGARGGCRLRGLEKRPSLHDGARCRDRVTRREGARRAFPYGDQDGRGRAARRPRGDGPAAGPDHRPPPERAFADHLVQQLRLCSRPSWRRRGIPAGVD